MRLLVNDVTFDDVHAHSTVLESIRFAHGTGHCNLIGPLVTVQARYTDVPRPSRFYVEGLAGQTRYLPAFNFKLQTDSGFRA